MKLQKTDLARELLRSPRRDLPAGERMLLITVDGRRDLPQLRELARNLGLDPAVVETLYGRGLIAPVAAEAPGVDGVTAPQGPVTQGRAGTRNITGTRDSAGQAGHASGMDGAGKTIAPAAGPGMGSAHRAGVNAPRVQRSSSSPQTPSATPSDVSVAAAGAQAATGHEQARQALIAAQEAAGAQARRLLRAKVYALDLVARMLAGQDGDLRALARHIDNEEGLLLWIEVAAQHLRERAGEERSERFRQRVLEELGLASALV